MATIRPATIPTKRLASAITSAATTFQLTDILGWDGSALTSASFGTKAYGVFRDAANNHIELFEFDPSTIASSSISILLRGLKFDGDLTTEVSGNKRSWTKGTLVELGTHVPQLFRHYVDTLEAQTIAGVKTFSALPATTAGNPVADNDLVRKAYADAILAGGSGIPNRVVVAGNAGATVSAGQLVYLDVADGEWKLCDADTAATVDNIILGLAQGSGTDGNPISGGILIYGLDSNQTGLTNNTAYYASNTAGAISSSVGTVEVSVGVARSTTTLLFYPRYNQQLTENQQDALVGSSGTPSASNTYVTTDDVSSAAASGKIVRATSTSLPALGAENLLNNATFGGTGADGALSITSGTTTIDLGNAAVVVKNYTSISITGTGVLGFSNANTNGTIIILKSRGDVTLTSSATPMIDARQMGGQASAGSGNSGNLGRVVWAPYVALGGTGGNDNSGANGGATVTAVSGINSNSPSIVYTSAAASGYYPLACGGAGGSGGAGSGTGGTGGHGGGALLIECRGALNFTTASGISIAGQDGSAGTSAGQGAGGGGGGAGGICLIVYNTLTSAAGTISVAGGTGGTGATGGSSSPGPGGAGGNGTSGSSNGGSGGQGGDTSGGTGGGSGGGGGANFFGTTNGTNGTAGGNTGTSNQGPGGGGGGGASGYALVLQNKARA